MNAVNYVHWCPYCNTNPCSCLLRKPIEFKFTSSTPRGWECPRCQKIHAPHVDECDCKPLNIGGAP